MHGSIHGWACRGALLATLFTVGLGASAEAHPFLPSRNLSETAEGSDRQQVATGGSHVYVAWSDKASGSGDLYLRRSTNGGATFEERLNLSEGNSTRESFAVPGQVLAYGEHVYVAWTEGGLRFRVSHDRGETWGPVQELTGHWEGGIQLAASGSDVYMAFFRSLEDELGDILLLRSHTHGDGFGDLQVISERWYGTVRLAVDGARVYVAWDDGGSNDDGDLFFRRSLDRGVTFEAERRLISSPNDDTAAAALVAREGRVYLVAAECPFFSDFNCEVLFLRSLDGGTTFEPALNVSQTEGHSVLPLLVVRGSRVYVAWMDGGLAGPRDILLTQSMDDGATFLPPVNVSGTKGDSLFPRMVEAGEGVRLAWEERENYTTAVMSRGTEGLGLELGPAVRLSENAAGLDDVWMAASHCGGDVHVLWREETEGNTEVLYRRTAYPGFPVRYCE